jgi:hypothetical protein
MEKGAQLKRVGALFFSLAQEHRWALHLAAWRRVQVAFGILYEQP